MELQAPVRASWTGMWRMLRREYFTTARPFVGTRSWLPVYWLLIGNGQRPDVPNQTGDMKSLCRQRQRVAPPVGPRELKYQTEVQ